MDGKTYSWSAATSIRRWTNTTGVLPSPSARCSSTISIRREVQVVPAVEGTGLADVIPARGAAFGDLFNDGKIDVVINWLDHTPVLLRNVNADHNHWVGLKLVGGPKSPRDAIGATVYLTAGRAPARRCMSGGSYKSSNDLRVHFGLGERRSRQGRNSLARRSQRKIRCPPSTASSQSSKAKASRRTLHGLRQRSKREIANEQIIAANH